LALLAAPRRINMAISAVAFVKTSGVFVTTIFFFFVASISIFPKPTAKLEIILIFSESLEIKLLSNFSVSEDNIPSQPSLSFINSSLLKILSSLFNLTSKSFLASSSLELISFLVISIFSYYFP